MNKTAAGTRIAFGAYALFIAALIFVADRRGTRYLASFIGGIRYGDKIGHFLLMGGLAFFANLAFTKTLPRLRFVTRASVIVAVLVVLEEISQLFVRGRTFDLSDLVADFLGIMIFGELGRRIGLRIHGHD